jgi:GNAT superfamily N-acetyltransferase
VEIVDYRPEHAGAFRALNEAWIAKYFTLEPKDREVLADPQGTIIDPGGRIFMALEGDEAVGCVALLKLADGGFEIAKMTVREGLRGSGLGRALLEKCFEAAAGAGAPRLYLETNSVLGPALSLYRSMGFKQLNRVRDPARDYARVDIWMERALP